MSNGISGVGAPSNPPAVLNPSGTPSTGSGTPTPTYTSDSTQSGAASSSLGAYPTSAYQDPEATPGDTQAPVTDQQLDLLGQALPSANNSPEWRQATQNKLHPGQPPGEHSASTGILDNYVTTLGMLASAAKSGNTEQANALRSFAANQANSLGIPQNSHNALVQSAISGRPA